jgi:hypothetical protein
VTATSVPGLIATFQNEWDALMLETYTLKQHLDTTRQVSYLPGRSARQGDDAMAGGHDCWDATVSP